MSARLLALYCLLTFVMPLGMAGSDGPPEPELLVYLRADVKQSFASLSWLKRELTPLMHSAGYRVEFRDPQSASGAPTADELVVVELHGTCGVTAGSAAAESAPEDLNQLASTSISDGHVLPFASVNCGNLNRTLAPSLAGEAGARRDFLYGRAMARVVAHELYHMIVSTREHTTDGVSKPCFTLSDLLSERFAFEAAVLAKFRRTVLDRSVEFAGDVVGELSATGR